MFVFNSIHSLNLCVWMSNISFLSSVSFSMRLLKFQCTIFFVVYTYFSFSHSSNIFSWLFCHFSSPTPHFSHLTYTPSTLLFQHSSFSFHFFFFILLLLSYYFYHFLLFFFFFAIFIAVILDANILQHKCVKKLVN